MKRLHVHISVDDLDQSVRFYSTLFAAEPTVVKTDYAKWMLDDPRVNFAISMGQHANRGIEHLGIQVESEEELADVYARLRTADRPIREEGATTCCYAKSEKSWIADPQGVVWETFHTTGEAVNYGAGPELLQLASDNAAVGACCMPTIPAAEARPVASCCS
jgi:catechol 2,3-dioxygenase-like lactoylglutathione lyase family enzyme